MSLKVLEELDERNEEIGIQAKENISQGPRDQSYLVCLICRITATYVKENIGEKIIKIKVMSFLEY